MDYIDSPTFFEINSNYKFTTKNVFGETVLIFDDILTEKCFINLENISNSFPKTLFIPNHYSQNGKTYIDARTTLEFTNNYLYQNFILSQIFEKFNGLKVSWFNYLVINFTKTVAPKKNMIGNVPHYDQANMATVLFFDDIEGNGTGFYRTKTGRHLILSEADQEMVFCNDYLKYGYDYYFTQEDFETFYDAKEFIQAKKNRLIIYGGRMLHGAVHNENMFRNNFRKTLITFHFYNDN